MKLHNMCQFVSSLSSNNISYLFSTVNLLMTYIICAFIPPVILHVVRCPTRKLIVIAVVAASVIPLLLLLLLPFSGSLRFQNEMFLTFYSNFSSSIYIFAKILTEYLLSTHCLT